MPPRRRKPKDEYEQPAGESVEDEGSVRIHEAYLQHRLGGGEAATPEAFQRAVEQFERLPGAVRTGPATSRPAQPRSPESEASGEREAEPEPDGDQDSDDEPPEPDEPRAET